MPFAAPAAGARQTQVRTARARFSWRIFFSVLIPSWLGISVAFQYLGLARAQLLMVSVQVLSSAWVLFDARQKGVPKPLRWGLGSLLLWIVIFPWYLARRRNPQAPCLFIEAEAGPIARAVLLILSVAVLVGLALFIMNGLRTK